MKNFFHFITVDPVNLSIKGKFFSVLACFFSILLSGWFTKEFAPAAHPVIVASMGASAVILFIIPHSPLAQPWPLIGGQIVSALTGVFCAHYFSDTVLASAFSAGGSVFFMMLLRCLHPPGAATALIPIMAGKSLGPLDYSFAFIPVGVNVMAMLLMALILNRWLLRHEYPVIAHQSSNQKNKSSVSVEFLPDIGISEQDLETALASMDIFVDVSSGDLKQLFTFAQLQRLKRYSDKLVCADIMVKHIPSVEYGTEVEDAWKMMHRQKLKALPVVDRANRVIGIVTWHDFFKCIILYENDTFLAKFTSFIRRTNDVKTNKPESIGHIMTSPVSVLPEDTDMLDLVPLMSNLGYRQIPIVNHEQRLTGMVYQADLIAALFNRNHELTQPLTR